MCVISTHILSTNHFHPPFFVHLPTPRLGDPRSTRRLNTSALGIAWGTGTYGLWRPWPFRRGERWQVTWDGKDGDCGDQRKMQMQLASYRFAQCRFVLKGYLHIGYHMVTYKIHIVLVHGSRETTFPKRTSIVRQSEWALRGQIKRSRLVKYLDQVCVDLESQSHVWGPENKLNSLGVYFQTIWTTEDVV